MNLPNLVPDTLDYMIAGYVVIGVMISGYLLSLYIRWRRKIAEYQEYKEKS